MSTTSTEIQQTENRHLDCGHQEHWCKLKHFIVQREGLIQHTTFLIWENNFKVTINVRKMIRLVDFTHAGLQWMSEVLDNHRKTSGVLMRKIWSIIYHKKVELLANTIYHSSGKGDKAAEEVCLYASSVCVWDCKWSTESRFGKPDPEQLKQLYQQTDCWCRIYHINIIYKISVQSNTQGWKGLSCQSSIPEDSFKGGMCSRNRMFDQITNLWGNPVKVARSIMSLRLVCNMRFDNNKVFTVWYLS